MKKNDEKFTSRETIGLVIISLCIGLSIGFLLKNNKTILKVGNTVDDEYLQQFIDTYEYVNENYYSNIDKEELINNAISGMLDSLDDPYSTYLDEDTYSNFNITLNGSYKGIGIQINKESDDDYISVISVFENSPASIAGIKPGDKISYIDGISTKDYTASQFSELVKNSNSTSFEFTIIRDSEEIKLTVNKSTVELTSVLSKTYELNDKKIGYIYISIFAENTSTQFETELKKLEQENIDSLIIDVRSNTGGKLTSVTSILDLFLNNKQIIYQFEQNGKIDKTYATGNDSPNYKIVLLGNEYSASASEVLISSLMDNLNSTFIGKKTYGKGTVQELITLSDGNQYKITIKKWLTPNGVWINDNEGINPTIEVDLDEKYYETALEEDDTQLQYALNYLSE